MEKVEIVELGYPQSIIQRENEPITELIETELLVEQLESRIKELEKTIENMKSANEWISVDDELPENIRAVIVRDNGISPIRSIALFQDNIFYPDFAVLKHENITHWKPIN